MPVHDRSISKLSNAAHEYIVITAMGAVANEALIASTTGHEGVKYYGPGPGKVVRCQIRVRAKANADNTVTITPTINGTAITGGALAVTGVAAPNLVEAVPTGAFSLVPNDILAFNTGAFGGTTPAFRGVQVVFTLRVSGDDIQPGIDL